MANEPADRPSSLLNSVVRMVEAAVNDGAGYDTLIHVLSLLCLVSILNHGHTRGAQAAPAGGANPLHKLLGDLTKGDGGGLGPDALVSLLPLLNSPQLKNKLNPATIGAVMGLLNNMGDKSEPPKADKSADKAEKAEKAVKNEEKAEVKRDVPPTAATVTSLDVLAEKPAEPEPADGDKKGLGKYLNWKSNF